MTTLSLRHHGPATPVPLGSYTGTLTSELRDHVGVEVNVKQITATVTTPHNLGSLAAGLTTLLGVSGTVIDLAITLK